MESSEFGSDIAALEERLHSTTDRWNEVKRKTADRQERLEQVVPLARKYTDVKSKIGEWVIEAERKFQAIETDTCDQPTLERRLRLFRRLRDDNAAHKSEFEKLNEISPVLVENCEGHGDIVEDETQDLNSRYDDLRRGVTEAQEKLESLKFASECHHNAVKSSKEAIVKYKKLLKPRVPFGIDITQGKEDVKDLKTLQGLVRGDEPVIRDGQSAGKRLGSLLNEKSPAAALVNHETQLVSQRYHDLCQALEARKAILERDMVRAHQFYETLRELEQWLPRLEEAVSSQEPISSHLLVVERQLARAEVTGPFSFLEE